MLVALGFALCFLVVLALGRTFWSLAMRLGASRRAKQIPVAMLELQADRDRLRAEYAMMTRKTELRVEDIRTRMTEQMAEVSRNRNRVQSLLADVQNRDEALKSKDREIAALTEQVSSQKTNLDLYAETVERLKTEAGSRDKDLQAAVARIAELSINLRDKNAALSRLTDELHSTGSQPSPSQANPDDPQERLRRRIAQISDISNEMSQPSESPQSFTRNTLSQTAPSPPPRHANLDRTLLAAENESSAMTSELEALDKLLAKVPEKPVVVGPAKRQGAMANVISLAQRIRALQHGTGD